MRLDNQNAKELARTKEEEIRKTKQFENELEIRKDANKYDLEDRNAERQHERDLQLKTLEKSLDIRKGLETEAVKSNKSA